MQSAPDTEALGACLTADRRRRPTYLTWERGRPRRRVINDAGKDGNVGMTGDQNIRLFLFGDNKDVLEILEKYIKLMLLPRHEIVGITDYESCKPDINLALSADFCLFGLFRNFGVRLRAEGIASLERVFPCDRKALVYGFNLPPDMMDNPLIWDAFNDTHISAKLAAYNGLTMEDRGRALEQLKTHFAQYLFTVDGH